MEDRSGCLDCRRIPFLGLFVSMATSSRRVTAGDAADGKRWSPEEAAEYTARRDFRLVQLLSRDRRALATAQRLGLFRKQARGLAQAEHQSAAPARSPRRAAQTQTVRNPEGSARQRRSNRRAARHHAERAEAAAAAETVMQGTTTDAASATDDDELCCSCARDSARVVTDALVGAASTADSSTTIERSVTDGFRLWRRGRLDGRRHTAFDTSAGLRAGGTLAIARS